MLPKQRSMLRDITLTENKQTLAYMHLERKRVIVVGKKGEGTGKMRVAVRAG